MDAEEELFYSSMLIEFRTDQDYANWLNQKELNFKTEKSA